MLASGSVEDFVKIVRFRISYVQFEEEAVELRFGEGVGTLHLDRVLRGKHKEGAGYQMLLSGDRDMSFLHCFKESALRFWRGTVDLVGK